MTDRLLGHEGTVRTARPAASQTTGYYTYRHQAEAIGARQRDIMHGTPDHNGFTTA
jgi:hypothetical protein